MCMSEINVSIVLYNTNTEQLNSLLRQLCVYDAIKTIYLIDNSPKESKFEYNNKIKYIRTGKNLGYGVAHNIALGESVKDGVKYHLVVNSDIELSEGCIENMVNYMDTDSMVASMMPKVLYPDGSLQYLCKLLPSPFDLFIRRFIPNVFFPKRRDMFELRHTGYDKIMNIPYLSGCFMLLRMSALEVVGFFDERFFLYPEDLDLTRRLHKMYKTLYYPDVTIVHHHNRESYRNVKMLFIHIYNMIKYFNKWGWFFDEERKQINIKTLSQFGEADSDKRSED